MEAVFSYRSVKEDEEAYIKNVESLVQKLLKDRWGKETFKKKLLTNCYNDREVVPQIKMKVCQMAKDVEDTLKRFDNTDKINQELRVNIEKRKSPQQYQINKRKI